VPLPVFGLAGRTWVCVVGCLLASWWACTAPALMTTSGAIKNNFFIDGPVWLNDSRDNRNSSQVPRFQMAGGIYGNAE
jgi:hypothetical protein